MPQKKTRPTQANVEEFLNSVKNARQRNDSFIITKMMAFASGQKPTMWGPSIIGFGCHQYTYANGKPGEICKIGFSPRARSLVFYLPNFHGREECLEKLGKYQRGVGCLYIKTLDDIDIEVLGEMFKKAYHHKRRDTEAP